MHKDVIGAIFTYQLNELLDLAKKGEHIPQEKFIEALLSGLSSTHKEFVEMADTCKTYGNTIIRLQKELSRERRIVQLFLQNHKLDYAYDNFEARILERIFEIEELKSKVEGGQP